MDLQPSLSIEACALINWHHSPIRGVEPNSFVQESVFWASDTVYLPFPGRATERVFVLRPAHEAQEALEKPHPPPAQKVSLYAHFLLG